MTSKMGADNMKLCPHQSTAPVAQLELRIAVDTEIKGANPSTGAATCALSYHKRACKGAFTFTVTANAHGTILK